MKREHLLWTGAAIQRVNMRACVIDAIYATIDARRVGGNFTVKSSTSGPECVRKIPKNSENSDTLKVVLCDIFYCYERY